MCCFAVQTLEDSVSAQPVPSSSPIYVDRNAGMYTMPFRPNTFGQCEMRSERDLCNLQVDVVIVLCSIFLKCVEPFAIRRTCEMPDLNCQYYGANIRSTLCHTTCRAMSEACVDCHLRMVRGRNDGTQS